MLGINSKPKDFVLSDREILEERQVQVRDKVKAIEDFVKALGPDKKRSTLFYFTNNFAYKSIKMRRKFIEVFVDEEDETRYQVE